MLLMSGYCVFSLPFLQLSIETMSHRAATPQQGRLATPQHRPQSAQPKLSDSRQFFHKDTQTIGRSLSRQGSRDVGGALDNRNFTFGAPNVRANHDVHWIVHQDPQPGPIPRSRGNYQSGAPVNTRSRAIEASSVRSSLSQAVDTRPQDHHFAASGLGYGPGHRMYYRYVHKDWDQDVRVARTGAF